MQILPQALAVILLMTICVALSFGEFGPDCGKSAPILATDCGAKPLVAPRLIVPGDGHASRVVAGVISIDIR